MLLDLDPVMFRLGPLAVRWYGFFMAVSMAVGVWLVIKNGVARGLDEDNLTTLSFWTVLGGVVGARALYVLTNLSDYLGNPIEMLRVDHGGLSFHGALAGGALAAWLAARRARFDFHLIGDLFVPGLALGITLVRIGNIFNQEVLGRMTALGWERHPAQVVGSLIGVVLLVRHNLVARRRPPDGHLFWSFFFWYSLLRGAIEETVRENPLYWPVYLDERLGLGLFTLTQLVTPPLIVLALVMMRRMRERAGRFVRVRAG